MKKLVTGFLLVVLVFSLKGWASASNFQPNPATIEKATFIHYFNASQSKPTWDDSEDDFRLIAGGVRWWTSVSYEVNPSGSGLGSEAVISTLGTSSETWDTQTLFELFVPPTLTSGTAVGYDGVNRLVWGGLDPDVIAVTYLWYYPATKQIVEFDMVFNNYFPWSASGASGKMDLQNIATHEFGHNGLGDLRPAKDQALTMYAFSSLGETIKRTLGTGDILGIKKLYGN